MNNDIMFSFYSEIAMKNIHALKIRHLEAFVEVARQKSVSRAARSLHLTQPAVTRTLRELEQICGARLVERDGRGIRLTRQGGLFLRHAGASLASARTGIGAVSEAGQNEGPPVRVGALPTASATHMPAAVHRYLQAGMGNRLRIASGENHVLLDQLRDGVLDLVIGRLPAPENMEGLRFEPLHRDRVIFVVSAQHPLAGDQQIAAGSIDEYPVLMPPPGSIIRPFVDRLFVELGISEPRRAIETVSDSFGRAYLRRFPLAIWVISRGVVAAEITAGEFVALPIDTESTLGSVGLVTRGGAEFTPAAQYFIDILRAVASDGEAGIAGQNGRPV